MVSKKILAVDFVFIVGSLFVILLTVGYASPLVIAPIENETIRESEVLFSIQKSDNLYIDSNINFTSPKQYLLKEGLEFDLKPGVYYFKTK